MKLADKLTCAANRHAADIGASKTCGHYGKDGSSPFDRIKACGETYQGAGEIVACGQTTPKEAVAAWMSDKPHKDIVLGNYTQVGISMVNDYWVVDWDLP